jgi:DNA-binding transcriptional ArsR family regulator
MVVFELTAADVARVRFAVSPVAEVVHTARVLANRSVHGHHRRWLATNASTIRELLQEKELGFLFRVIRGPAAPDFLSPRPKGSLGAIEDELAKIRETEDSLARDDIRSALAGQPGGERLERELGRRGVASTLADQLELLWQQLVRPAWPQMHAVLERDIARRAFRAADTGLQGAFHDLQRTVTLTPSALVVSGSQPQVVVPSTGRGILCIPSVFVRPHAESRWHPQREPLLFYPARGAGLLWHAHASRPGRAAATANLLGATRAEVLRAVAGPATTTTLARQLGRSAGSISEHLTVLHESGLVSRSRSGRRVLYRQTPLGRSLADGATCD